MSNWPHYFVCVVGLLLVIVVGCTEEAQREYRVQRHAEIERRLALPFASQFDSLVSEAKQLGYDVYRCGKISIRPLNVGVSYYHSEERYKYNPFVREYKIQARMDSVYSWLIPNTHDDSLLRVKFRSVIKQHIEYEQEKRVVEAGRVRLRRVEESRLWIEEMARECKEGP